MTSSAVAAPTKAGPSDDGGWLRAVASVPDPRNHGQLLHLQRSWPRSSEHVLLEYAAVDHSRRVVGQWFADEQRLHGVATAMRAVSGQDAAAVLPAQRIVLHASGVDRRLRVLKELLDDPSATLVVHRPERRAVVRLEGGGSSGPGRRWLKVVRGDRLAALVARARHVASLDSVPRLIEVRAGSGITVWQDIPGVALGDMLQHAEARAAMADVGGLLRRLHALAPPTDPVLRHGTEAEQAVLRSWMGHLMAFDPVTRRRVGSLYTAVIRLLLDVPAGVRHVTVHRDLHDGQVLVAPSGLGLLDPDTVAAGEPELDLGNLCGHLILAACQARVGRDDAAHLFDTVVEAYGRDGVDGRRLQVYTAAALLRLAAVHAMRPATRAAVSSLVVEAGRALSPVRVGVLPTV